MAIDLDARRKDNSQSSGNLTDESVFAGDISGDFVTGITVSGLMGVPFNAQGPQSQNQGYVYNAGTSEYNLAVVVTEGLDTSVNGDVTGNFSGGLNVTGLLNYDVPAGQAFSGIGEALVSNASNQLVPTPLNISNNVFVTQSSYTANRNEKVVVDSSANAVTIEMPANPVNGDNFTIYFLKGTNAVTVNATPPITSATPYSLVCVFYDTQWSTQNIGAPTIQVL